MLSFASLRSHPVFRVAVVVALVSWVVYLLGLIGLPDPIRGPFSDWLQLAMSGLAAGALAYASARSPEKRMRWVWGLLAVGQLSSALGDLLWAYFSHVLQISPFPSIADVFYLAYYPFFALGVWLLPAPATSDTSRVKFVLDVFLVLGSASVVFGVFWINPQLLEQALDFPTRVVSLAYPIFDLVLLFSLIVFVFRRQTVGHGAIWLLLVNISCQIVSDLIFGYQSLIGTYVSGSAVDMGWFVAYIALFVAGSYQAVWPNWPEARPTSASQIGLVYLPYLAFAVACGAALWGPAHQVPLNVLIIAVGGLGLLALIRQVLELHERFTLLATEREYRRAETVLLDLSGQLLAVTQEQDILECATHMAAQLSAVEFAAIVLPNAQGQLLMRAVQGWPAEVVNTLTLDSGSGSQSGYTMQVARPVLVADYERVSYFHVPDVVHRYGFRSGMSVPLIYEHQPRGVLLVHTRSPRQFTELEAQRLWSLANQTAVALERARLFAAQQQEAENNLRLYNATQRHVAELTTLHRVALASAEATNEDMLIEQVTRIIGETLYPDNFGILLLTADGAGVRAHPTYRYRDVQFSQINPVARLGEGITGRVALTGQPICIADVHLETQYLNIDPNTRSEVCVPIKSQECVLGVINAESLKPGAYTAADEQLLMTLAGQLAVAFEKLRLIASEQRRIAALKLLHEVGLDLTTHLELPVVLQMIIERATRLVQAPMGGVWVLNSTRHLLVLSASQNIPEEYQAIPVPWGEGLVGRVAQQGQTLQVADYAQWAGRILSETVPFHGILGAPIKWQGEVLGVITVDHPVAHTFTAEEVELITLFANQAAVALINARLFETERQHRNLAEALRQVGLLLTASLNLDQVLDQVLGLLARVVPYSSACVFMVEKGQMYMARQRGYEAFGEPALRALAQAPFEVPKFSNWKRMVETGRPTWVTDTSAELDWVTLPDTDHIRSWLGAPLIVQPEGLLAFFSLDHSTPGFYQAEHAQRLEAFATQAAFALQNARLFTRTQQNEAELAALLDSMQLVSASLEPEEVLQHIATSLCRILNMGWCSLSTYDAVHQKVQTLAVYNAAGQPRPERRIAETFDLAEYPATLKALLHNQVVVVRAADPDQSSTEVALLQEYGEAVLLMFALRAGGQVEGLVELYTRDIHRHFTPDEIRLAQGLADQAALALAKARLYNSERQQRALAEALREAGVTLSGSLDVETVLDLLLVQVARIVPYISGNIMLVEETQAQIARARGYEAFNPEADATLPTHLDLTHTPWLRRAIQSPVRVADVTRDADWVVFEASRHVRSWIAAPLRLHDRTIALFSLDHTQPGFYTATHLENLHVFAGQAALALHNAQLYQSQTRHLKQLEAVRQASLSLTGNFELRPLLQTILHTTLTFAQQALDAYVFLYTAETDTLTFGAAIWGDGQAKDVTNTPRPHGLTYAVARSGEPHLITDMRTHPLYADQNLAERRAIMGFPLKIGQRVVGVMNIAYSQPRTFTDEEVYGLQLLGDHAAVAIENARLLAKSQATMHELAELYDRARQQAADVTLVSQMLRTLNATSNINHAFEAVTQMLQMMTKSDRIELAICDAFRETVTVVALEHYHPELSIGTQFPLTQTASSPAILAGQTHLSADLTTDAKTYLWERTLAEAGYRSQASLPLRGVKGVMGALSLAWPTLEGYGPINLSLVMQITEALALVLEKDRLYQETRRRDAMIRALANAGEWLLLPGRHLGEALIEVLSQFTRAAHASRAYIFENVMQPDGLVAQRRYAWAQPVGPGAVDPEAWLTLSYQTAPLDRWAKTLTVGEPLAGLRRNFADDEQRLLDMRAIRSLIIVPIFSGGRWWGFWGLDDCEHERLWLPAEVEVLKSAADALGAAFARQRSEIAEREERIFAEALRDIAAALNSTLHFDEVLKRILDNLGRVVPHDAATIMLVKSRVARIVRAETYTDQPLMADWETARLPIKEAPHLKRMFETGKAFSVPDMQTNAEWPAPLEAPWACSYIGTPIKQKGRLMGFINLYSATPGFFTATQAERLRAFTDQAGVAIENAQFYEELERRVDDRTRALADANEQLKQLDKLKDEFISTVSHELRTPLTNIKLYLGLLAKRGPDALERHLPTLLRETERLRSLIEGLLDLSRLQTRAVTLQRKPQVLNDLVDEVLAAHQARADAKLIAITHLFPDEMIEVAVDRSEILQVFTNLVGNAVAYTPPQGAITIRSYPAKLGARFGVAVQFHNTGPTIAPADLPHLFERFYRGQTGRDSGEPGTGLGLAICKEIVERHQGRLEVESTAEKGTTFTIWLPLSE